jgi:hypothetical protein
MMRRTFGYLAAAAMTPYLLIKVSWVAGGLLGLVSFGPALSPAGWVVLNLVTIVMAAAAIALGLALAQPWGMRIPALPLLAGAWLGTGFLVPMLPYLVLNALLGENTGEPVLPAWEGVLITAGFAGVAVGLAVALPLYLRERWPQAFRGRVRAGMPATAVAGSVAAVAVGLLNLYWATGGRAGLEQAGARDRSWYLLVGNSGIWALVAAVGVWSLTRGLPLWLPVSATWVASGFLFAWSAWKLPLTGYLAIRPGDSAVWPERLDVAAIQYAVAVAAGLLLLAGVRQVVGSPRTGAAR